MELFHAKVEPPLESGIMSSTTAAMLMAKPAQSTRRSLVDSLPLTLLGGSTYQSSVMRATSQGTSYHSLAVSVLASILIVQ